MKLLFKIIWNLSEFFEIPLKHYAPYVFRKAFGYNDYNGCNITLTSGKTIKVQEEISHVIAIIDKEESK